MNVCTICGNAYTDPESLERHVSQCGRTRATCHGCLATFATQSSLRRHQRIAGRCPATRSPTGKRVSTVIIECPECKRSFYRRDHLDSHECSGHARQRGGGSVDVTTDLSHGVDATREESGMQIEDQSRRLPETTTSTETDARLTPVVRLRRVENTSVDVGNDTANEERDADVVENRTDERDNTQSVDGTRQRRGSTLPPLQNERERVDRDDDNPTTIPSGHNETGFVVTDRDEAGQIHPIGDDEEDIERMRQLVEQYWSSMKSRYSCRRVVDLLNVRVWEPSTGNQSDEFDTRQLLLGSWRNINYQAKVNCSAGAILRNRNTGELRYFHSSSNNATVFQQPRLVTTEAQLIELYNDFAQKDVEELCVRRRPSTVWTLYAVTNVTFFIYKLIGMGRVGNGLLRLPKHLRDNRHIVGLTHNGHGRPYHDNLCMFRCLALALSCRCYGGKCKCKRASSKKTAAVFHKFKTDQELQTSDNAFQGVADGDLLAIERIFDVRITVFSLKSSGMSTVEWTSRRKTGIAVRVNRYKNHFSYIKSVEHYARAFSCSDCDTCFDRASNFHRHVCAVDTQTQFVFPGGAFKKKDGLFEKIQHLTGRSFPQVDKRRFYPYRITFDIECLLVKDNLPDKTAKLTYTNRHEFLSVSTCSNIPGYDNPRCFVRDGETQDCIDEFVDYLLEMADKASSIVRESLSEVVDELRSAIDKIEEAEKAFKDAGFSNKRTYMSRERCAGIADDLLSFIRVVPVVGFNSQRYDINVMKGYLIKSLAERDGSAEFVVKKGDSMMCVQTARLKLVDICNFIAPGYNYSKYLAAYGVEETKGFFPYEWMDSLEKLEMTELPPRDAFSSALRGTVINNEDYELCQRVWIERDMSTFKDFLIWYNNADVVPFLKAIEKHSSIYMAKGIDMLKSALSLPGLAVHWLFCETEECKDVRTAYAETTNESTVDPSMPLEWSALREAIVRTRPVCLLDNQNGDLFKTLKDNTVGGPSIVFHRMHEAGETVIRPTKDGNGKKCASVVGYDANALYLYCTMQEMPVGKPRRRLAENNFVVEKRQKCSKVAHGWLAWQEWCVGSHIQTEMDGGEVRVGRHNLPVDGYCRSNNTVYQFHGCYWHGHNCDQAGNSMFDDSRMSDCEKKVKYFQSLGYQTVVVWECEWRQIVKDDGRIRAFLKVYFDVVFGDQKGYTQEEVIERIADGRLFGFVECDVSVPDTLRDKFHEMPPVFKNVELSRNDLSDHMKEFAEASGFMKRPQRSLIGSMFGEKIVLHSALLRWYLQHGMCVTHIYQVVEYEHRAVFRQFGASVTEARRAGDASESKKLLAETAKLVGNSVYGKTITDKTRHRLVKYDTDERNASMRVRASRFISVEDVGSGVYETLNFKKKVCIDVPVTLGFVILQLAKLRMLEFYYDFVDVFVPRNRFQYVQMDTDSAYFALSTSDLSSAVKVSLRAEFCRQYADWLPREYCDKHRTAFHKSIQEDLSWSPQSCCKAVRVYDSRTPGLFKSEFAGTGMLALNSKTYHCWGGVKNPDKNDDGTKCSSKGISKRTNTLTREHYERVLRDKVPVSGVNRGFVRKRNVTYTYEQWRAGLSYFYPKRKVRGDGVTTDPIDR